MNRVLQKPSEAEFRKNINTNNQYLDRHVGWKSNEVSDGGHRLASNTDVNVVGFLRNKRKRR